MSQEAPGAAGARCPDVAAPAVACSPVAKARPRRRPAAAPALRSPLVPCFRTAPDRQASKQRLPGKQAPPGAPRGAPSCGQPSRRQYHPAPPHCRGRCERRLRRGRKGMAGGAAEGPWGPPWAWPRAGPPAACAAPGGGSGRLDRAFVEAVWFCLCNCLPG